MHQISPQIDLDFRHRKLLTEQKFTSNLFLLPRKSSYSLKEFLEISWSQIDLPGKCA